MDFKFANNRFYLDDTDGENLAEVTFSQAGENLLIIDHTWVGDSLRGQGIAEQLVKAVVDYAREHNKKIMPLCPYASSEFAKKPEYADVLKK